MIGLRDLGELGLHLGSSFRIEGHETGEGIKPGIKTMPTLQAVSIDRLPTFWGDASVITAAQENVKTTPIRSLSGVRSGFACALHMHQPTIPAGREGQLISNLQHMFENPNDGDNHNAGVFAHCYGRMGEIIPQLVADGCAPRIMLDYSGNLLWGLQQMGREDVLDLLRKLVNHHSEQVEWLGTMWSHAVASSTPIPDLKLQMRAWQFQFLSMFGPEALGRVKGFSPPEMHLPNHPDQLYAYIKALKECGYEWLLVQEHSVEQLNGHGLTDEQRYGPTRLVARNSAGETVSITALIKTQGSDTKLVAQMQPYYEAKGRDRLTINNISIPSLVSQIADGENGGVMMNEFPRDYPRPWYEIKDAGAGVLGFNGTEYLAAIANLGISESDFPQIQPVGQHRIWQRVSDSVTVEQAIAAIQSEDGGFSMEGASWTNDINWVRGYENVLGPMLQLSVAFHQKFPHLDRSDETFQTALLYNLLLQTSCFRYWGQGAWTDYARVIFDRGMEALRG